PVLRWSINSRSTLAEGLYQYDALARLRDANLEHLERGRNAAGGGGEPDSGPGVAAAFGWAADVGRYLKLGPRRTALRPADRPRVLLIDELDKSDIDLPNDLLHVFEEGGYEVPELVRVADLAPDVEVLTDAGAEGEGEKVLIRGGRVRCSAFPFVV